MLKMRKKKILLSLIVLAVLTVLFGSIISDATEITTNSTGTTTITANTAGTNTGSVSINANTNTNTNTNTNVSAINSTVSTYSNSSANTNANTSSTTGLPYAGAGNIMGAVVLALVFVGSAVYAYKKVTDYNV